MPERPPFSLNAPVSRRQFLRQTFAFSALAALGPAAGLEAFAQNAAATIQSPAPDPKSAHMLMVGDWGTDKYLDQQVAVARAMRGWCDNRHVRPESLFMLGDNWYGSLHKGVDSDRWQSQFEQMYPSSSFPGPAYAVLGNHDYENKGANKVDAQLAYAGAKKGTRWTMPSKWYTFKWPQANPVATFICLDTNFPGSKSDPWPWSFTMKAEERDAQDAWFRAELAKPRTTPFLIVIAHHPLYTNGIHKDNHQLINDWDQLLRQARVDFYITGHDHDLQHLEFAGHPTSFVISGGGGAELVDWTTAPEKRGPWGAKVIGFTDLELTSTTAILRHLDQNGHELHAFRKAPQGKMELLLPLSTA